MPHISVKSEVPEVPETPPEAASVDAAAVAKKKRAVVIAAGVAAVIVVGAAGFFAYRSFFAAPPPPPPVVKTKAPVTPKAGAPVAPKAPVAATPAPATPPATAPGPLSPTLDAIAHAPAKAIGKAQDAIDARRASGQDRVDGALVGADVADKPAAPAAPKTTTAKTAVTRGVSATTSLEAATEASAEFRSFVANAKISGVFPGDRAQGVPSRAMINGRLVRSGETVDGGLGILFDGADPEKRHLLFKDKSGAVVARRY